jgi:hypothetical protein
MTHRHLIGALACAFFLFLALSFVMTKPSAQSGTFTSVNVPVGVEPGMVAINPVTSRVAAELEYNDADLRMSVKSTEVTSVLITGTHARLSGHARLNGRIPVDFLVDVDDLGKPGTGLDQFHLQLSNGYDQGGTLKRGDIRILTQRCEDRDNDDRDGDRQATFMSELYRASLMPGGF